MKVLRIGIISPEGYKERTLAIAKGQIRPGPSDPKVWFTSIESAARILSQPNRELLSLIAREKPTSLKELSDRTGRAKSNLSRTLKTMERYGLVQLQKGQRGVLAPRVSYEDIRLEVPVRSNLAPA
ncbi:MAG: HVO_A0114 family putative DNA-binding protein [Sphingosinicella sp.]